MEDIDWTIGKNDEYNEIKKTEKNLLNIAKISVVIVLVILYFTLVKTEIAKCFIVTFGLSAFLLSKLIKERMKKRVWRDILKNEIKDLPVISKNIENEIKDQNKEYIFKVKIAFFAIIVPIILIICLQLLLLGEISEEVVVLGVPIFYCIYCIVLINLKSKEKKVSEKNYKKEIINKFFENSRNEFEYKDKVPVNSNVEFDYRHADYCDKYDWLNLRNKETDYVNGRIGQAYVEIADTIAYNNYHLNRSGRYAYIVFKGTFTTINLNKTFEKSKILLSKRKIVGSDLINISNSRFNKYFKIYGENREEILKYLDANMIKYIAEFREKYQIDFEIIFEDKIYVRFYLEDMLKIKNGKILDDFLIYKYYVITKFAKELVEKLDNM